MKTGIAAKKRTYYPWLIVAQLCVVGCLNYLDRTTITTMRSSIVQAIPMTDGQFGLLTSVFLWTYGLLSPVAGFLADKFNRSRVIITSLFIWSAVTFLTSFAVSFEQLVLTRFLMGVSEACYIPAALALIMDYHRGSTRSLANGLHMAGIAIGQSLGFVGGWMAERHAWNDAFALLGIIGIVYSLVLVFALKDPGRESPGHLSATATAQARVRFGEAIKGLLLNRNYLFALCGWSLLGIAGWIIIGWLPTFYKEHFNLSQTLAGLYATGYLHPFSLIGVIAGGALADAWSRRNARGRILLPACGMLIGGPAVFMASVSPVLAVVIAGFVVYAFTRAFMDANMMPVLCMITDPRYRATGYGVLNFFSCLVGGLGLYAGGALRDTAVNLDVVFRAAALLLVCCGLSFFMIRPRPQ